MTNEMYERGINVTVRDLRDCLEGLPDDMDVIVPVHDEDDANVIFGYRHVRTIGVLRSPRNPEPAFCLASSANGADMYSLMELNAGDIECEKQMF